jgi:hypothetical protein
LRLNWDTDPFAKKMRILISKYHSNYLSGYGKFNKYKTPHMNPLTKIYTANEPQWHRLEGNKRLYRTYVSRTRRRVINKELTKFKKAHPLLKKIPKKIRKQTNK